MKINKLSRAERTKICLSHYNRDAYDTCKGCPLQINTIHCYNGVVEELRKARNAVANLTELLRSVKDKEIEVE